MPFQSKSPKTKPSTKPDSLTKTNVRDQWLRVLEQSRQDCIVVTPRNQRLKPASKSYPQASINSLLRF